MVVEATREIGAGAFLNRAQMDNPVILGIQPAEHLPCMRYLRDLSARRERLGRVIYGSGRVDAL